jgi:hypothetical protein
MKHSEKALRSVPPAAAEVAGLPAIVHSPNFRAPSSSHAGSSVRHNSGEFGYAKRCRGAFSVVVLVCLVISTMVLASLLKITLLHDRQVGSEIMRVQTSWLADSGLERAAGRLAIDRAFEGETWTVNAARLGGRDPAVVAIRIEQVESQPLQRLIVVEATYPPEGPNQARITRQAIVTLTQEQ